MDLTIEISERDHASVRNVLKSIVEQKPVKTKINTRISLKYIDVSKEQLKSIIKNTTIKNCSIQFHDIP